MSWRQKDAEERFARLTRSTDAGLVFHWRGASGPGYLVDAPTARRIKYYFAHDWLEFPATFALLLIVLPGWPQAHPFLSMIVLGFLLFAVNRLIERCLLWRSPRAATRCGAEDLPPTPVQTYSPLEASCTLINIAILLAMILLLAALSHSVDGWLFAAAWVVILGLAALQVRQSIRRT